MVRSRVRRILFMATSTQTMTELASFPRTDSVSMAGISEGSPLGPLIWGLNARQVHDAWWRGQGVQCVSKGGSFEPNPGVELFMLLEPTELVTFDLGAVADAMVWSSTRVRRIRIVERSEEAFKEQISRDDSGEIVGVRRSYGHEYRVGHKVFLTDSASIAAAWASSSVEDCGWKVLRRAAGGRSARIGPTAAASTSVFQRIVTRS